MCITNEDPIKCGGNKKKKKKKDKDEDENEDEKESSEESDKDDDKNKKNKKNKNKKCCCIGCCSSKQDKKPHKNTDAKLDIKDGVWHIKGRWYTVHGTWSAEGDWSTADNKWHNLNPTFNPTYGSSVDPPQYSQEPTQQPQDQSYYTDPNQQYYQTPQDDSWYSQWYNTYR